MKLVALTYGTEGDTRPLAMLGRALMDAGHDVMLLADGATLGVARALGVPHAALAGNIQAELSASIATGKGVQGTTAALSRIANAHAESWMRQSADATAGADALIVSGLAAFVGFSVAEKLRLKVIGTGLIPITPTRDFPSPFVANGHLPRLLNRPSHRLVNGLIWRSFRKATNRARERVLDLKPRRAMWPEPPMLYGISPSLLTPPADWPSTAKLCGQWVQPDPGWTPPAPLQAFLQDGEPPIYVGFGSMTGFDRTAVLRALIAAAAGRRVLLYPGWAGLPEIDLPDTVFVLGNTPHDWLLPRTALAIHHGGSGTSHSAARAGVPSIVMPFAGDQFFWADQLRRRGVAPAALSARRLGEARLREAIAFAGEPATQRRARALGDAMAAENGLATAAAEIEVLLRG